MSSMASTQPNVLPPVPPGAIEAPAGPQNRNSVFQTILRARRRARAGSEDIAETTKGRRS
jgi:hypothetical protein